MEREERERRKKRITFPSAGSLPQWPYARAWAKPEPGTRNSIVVSQKWQRGPKPEAALGCLSRHSSCSLGQPVATTHIGTPDSNQPSGEPPSQPHSLTFSSEKTEHVTPVVQILLGLD